MIKKLHNRTSALPKFLWLMMLALLPAQLSAASFTYAYEGKSLFYTVIDEDAKTVSVSALNGTSGEVIIPSEVTNGTDTYSVIALEDKAFWQKDVTSVTIPNSVTEIGEYAFFFCQKLTSVNIPNSVTTIKYASFCNCYSLNTVDIPNSVTKIELSAFEGSALTSITIPNSVTSIGDNAFYDNPFLSSVTIPNSVTEIGKEAFGKCTRLSTVTFQSPNKDLVLGNKIFLNSGVSTIHFEGDDEGDYTIKSGMAQALEQSEQSDLDYVMIDFKGNYTIEEGAFEGISALYLLFYGKSYIGKKAFFNSNATHILFEDCQGIEDYAFATTGYNNSEFYLWCLNEEPPYVTNENAFSGLPKCGDSKNQIVFVPLKSIDKYKNAFGWNYFNVSGMGEINSLTFTPDEVHLDLRKSTTISYNLDATGDFEITNSQWTSSDEEVVVVNQSGMIQGNASGMAMIIFSFDDNYGFTHRRGATLVTVGDVDFSLDAVAEKGTIAVGETTGVKLTYGGQGYTVKSEQWATSDAAIATVDENGVITGVAPGEATITLTIAFDNDLETTRKISITVGDVDFSLDAVAEKSTIAVGETTGVKLTYGGQGYTVKSEQWATSDAAIATVDENGVITGVAPGEATITLTITFDNGLETTRKISITVTEKEESGIADIQDNGSGAHAEYYNLNGVRVNSDALTPGLYIKRQAGKSTKVLVK